MNHPELNGPMIGLTSTIPVEIVFAAGLKPVDLNNLFISSEKPERFIAQAETAGFSHNICAWIKGIYATSLSHGVKRIIAVTGGDCSNTVALGEVLSRMGIEVVPFEYPFNRDRYRLKDEMTKLMGILSASWEDTRKVKLRLDRVRAKLKELDRLTYEENLITGLENHLFLVSSSDFTSDVDLYEKKLDEFLIKVKKRRPEDKGIRLGYLGVPPIFGQFYEYIESLGARVVFNEVQRQFSLPYGCDDMVDLYLNYTYPYNIEGRIADIRKAITQRALDGLIHYTQTFCYRQIYDIILRENLSLPMLTLEGDRPGPVDSRTAIRIETFIEMLRDKRSD